VNQKKLDIATTSWYKNPKCLSLDEEAIRVRNYETLLVDDQPGILEVSRSVLAVNGDRVNNGIKR